MSDTRQPYHILGRLAGTATGWDQQDTFAMTLYDFEPAKGCTIPATNNLLIDFEEGTYEGVGGVRGHLLEAVLNAALADYK